MMDLLLDGPDTNRSFPGEKRKEKKEKMVRIQWYRL